MSLRNEAYNSIKKKMRRLIVMDKISIIIPCFNEEEALPIYYAEMKKVMDSMKKQFAMVQAVLGGIRPVLNCYL